MGDDIVVNGNNESLGTSYFKIYARAIAEFKDPTLKKLFNERTILFAETMYNFLENAISLFTNPYKASLRVQDRQLPYTLSESFQCDGQQNTFILQNPPQDDLINDSIFEYFVNGKRVGGQYNPITKTVTLDIIPDMDSVFDSEIYYIGNFNNILYDEEEYILSQFMVACWSEFITNDKLDIIRLLGDTDFKLTSNSSTLQAKNNWNTTTIERVVKKMGKYAWDCKYRGTYK